jgi:hypothetical protein
MLKVFVVFLKLYLNVKKSSKMSITIFILQKRKHRKMFKRPGQSLSQWAAGPELGRGHHEINSLCCRLE